MTSHIGVVDCVVKYLNVLKRTSSFHRCGMFCENRRATSIGYGVGQKFLSVENGAVDNPDGISSGEYR